MPSHLCGFFRVPRPTAQPRFNVTPKSRAPKAQKSEAIVLWKTSPSEEIVLCCLLEHFTLHWEAIKTITRSLVKVIIFFKI